MYLLFVRQNSIIEVKLEEINEEKAKMVQSSDTKVQIFNS